MKKVFPVPVDFTKREMFAMAAMQGLLANHEITNHVNGFPSAIDVIGYTDKLLKQLEAN